MCTSIDVVIPAGRADQRALHRAIRSVPDIVSKIIVVMNQEGLLIDDPSVIDSRIVPIYAKNIQNVSQARNVGINNASSEYIMFLDDDDVFADTQELQVALHAKPIWIVAPVYQVFRSGTYFSKIDSGIDYHSVLEGGSFVGVTGWCIRRSLLQSELFDESLPMLEDFELGTRLLAQHTPTVLCNPFYFLNREDGGGLSVNIDKYIATRNVIHAKFDESVVDCLNFRAVRNVAQRAGLRQLAALMRSGYRVNFLDIAIAGFVSLFGADRLCKIRARFSNTYERVSV